MGRSRKLIVEQNIGFIFFFSHAFRSAGWLGWQAKPSSLSLAPGPMG